MTTPSYVSLISLNSKTVDIAALGQKITAPVQEDSHIVKTELIYLGKDEFKKLFFSNDGENFSINRQLYDDYHNKISNTEINIKEFNDVMTFNKRFKMVDTDSTNISPLILSEHIFSCYEKDTGTDRDCWEICSVLDMQKSLNSIQCLCDMGVKCNVLSSLKWSEIENILKSETADYYDNSVNKSKNLIISNDPTRHVLQISTVFKSSSSDIKDCIIIFRYAVDMRDSCISSNKYFRFGNPEYLLEDLKIKVNNNIININFKPDIFTYNSELQANNDFNIEIDPVVFANDIFKFFNNYQRKPITINALWFNNTNTKNPDHSLYQASVDFNDVEAISNKFKKLRVRDDTVSANYSENTNTPMLRVIVKNRDDKVGDTITIYEVVFTLV